MNQVCALLILFINDFFQYYPPIYVLVSPMASFPTNTLCTPLSSPIRATCPAHLICLHFTTRAILGKEYRSFSSSLCSFLHSRHLVPLRSKYTPQHPLQNPISEMYRIILGPVYDNEKENWRILTH